MRSPTTLVVKGLSADPAARRLMQIAARRHARALIRRGRSWHVLLLGHDDPRSVADPKRHRLQLHGAFVVDSAATRRPIAFSCSDHGRPSRHSGFDPELRVINGRSWPGTERLDLHRRRHDPLALGEPDRQSAPDAPARFLFRRDERGTWAADTVFARADVPRVVTELVVPGRDVRHDAGCLTSRGTGWSTVMSHFIRRSSS